MTIKLIKRKDDKNTKKITAFFEREWKNANQEHFGVGKDWGHRKFTLLCTDREKILGLLEFDIEAGVVHIDDLIVAQERRKRGIGRKLALKAEGLAKKMKAHKIYLITGAWWPAVKFYESLGYKVTNRLPNHYFKKEFLEMSKPLE